MWGPTFTHTFYIFLLFSLIQFLHRIYGKSFQTRGVISTLFSPELKTTSYFRAGLVGTGIQPLARLPVYRGPAALEGKAEHRAGVGWL